MGIALSQTLEAAWVHREITKLSEVGWSEREKHHEISWLDL